MSILIKGMEMPPNCEECEWSTTDRRGFFGCRLTGNIVIRKREQDRPDWCPLVPVPEHGRLIDADELVHSYYHAPSFPNLCKAINEAATIIPAEEGET